MSKVYSFKDYDKYLSLKAGIGLWLVVIYLMKPYLLLVSAAGIGKGRSGSGGVGVEGFKNMVYPDNLVLMAAIMATLPTLLFIYAWGRRRPGASEMVQKVWQHGALLLMVGAGLDILVVFAPFVTQDAHHIQIAGWIQLVISVLIVVYLLFSPRVKDVLADFPEEIETADDKAGGSPLHGG